MSESRLLKLLAERHKDDVFVPHCKNGPTNAIGSRVLILDGWAMLATWSPLTMVGYEVKVSRADWLRDQKFTSYLPLCNLFFVVALKGIVELAELPEGVGLLEAIGTGTGERLVTRRKAARRDIETPRDLMAYALMWRSERVKSKGERSEQWRRLVAEDADAADLGYAVKGRIGKVMQDLRHENNRLAEKMRTYDHVRASLIELGLDPERVSSWSVENQIRAVSIRAQLETLAAKADGLAQAIHRLADPPVEKTA